MVDYFGGANSFAKNVEREYQRNKERYTFLKWGQQAFENFRVVPSGHLQTAADFPAKPLL